MTTRAIAEKLKGMQYREEPDSQIIAEAKEAGIVIVFGASDDLMELRGAVDDEIGCYDGGTIFFTPSGLVKNICDNETCPYAEKEKNNAIPIHALWCEESDYSWTYKTEIPHETFEILEDEERYCLGIVFRLSDVNAK
jgi:hypothetical protein